MSYETLLAVQNLQNDYVACIDDDDLERWPEFFTEQCLYKVIPRENADAGLPVAVMFCDSRGMLRDRIVALRNANIYAPHFYRHLVSNTRIVDESSDEIRAQTNYAVFQTLLDGETRVYNVGRYDDVVVRDGDQLKFKEKICVFDTYRIQTLMVTPI
ncbi:MAG TPA: anthranilate 1,2-dioxygenase [Gammaproteobacteria bacterium]|nr:anthranilate 1,2-dioxygenase [Gammaproteobacteria bacterium]